LDRAHQVDQAGALEESVASQIGAGGNNIAFTRSGCPMNSRRAEEKQRSPR
jgi:hypothetical protein